MLSSREAGRGGGAGRGASMLGRPEHCAVECLALALTSALALALALAFALLRRHDNERGHIVNFRVTRPPPVLFTQSRVKGQRKVVFF